MNNLEQRFGANAGVGPMPHLPRLGGRAPAAAQDPKPLPTRSGPTTFALFSEIVDYIASILLGVWSIALLIRWGTEGFGLTKTLAFALGLSALSMLYDIRSDIRKAARS